MVVTAKVLLVVVLLAAAGVAEVAAKPPGGAEAEVEEGKTEVVKQDDSIAAGEGEETGDVAVEDEEEQEDGVNDNDEGAEGEDVEKDAVEEKARDTEDRASTAEANKLTNNTTEASMTSAFEGSGESSSSLSEPVKADIADSVVEKILITDKPEVKGPEKPDTKENDMKAEEKAEDKSAPTAEKQKQDDSAVKKEPAQSDEVVKPVEDGDKAPAETVEEEDVTPGVVFEKSISKEGGPASQSHFFAYFIVLSIVTIVAYLVFHNKKKILGLIVEGRGSQARRRRSGGKEYRKLDTGVEDMMETGKETSMRQVIY